jgi:hypothetical protein
MFFVLQMIYFCINAENSYYDITFEKHFPFSYNSERAHITTKPILFDLKSTHFHSANLFYRTIGYYIVQHILIITRNLVEKYTSVLPNIRYKLRKNILVLNIFYINAYYYYETPFRRLIQSQYTNDPLILT